MAEKVTKDMNILEIAQKHPESIEVFHKYGLGCLGAKVHGYDPDAMVADMNALIEAVEG